MYILRNSRNAGAQPGVPLPGDILISGDQRKSYLVGPDHSHRRLDGEQHTEAVQRCQKELAAIPARKIRQKAEQDAIKRHLEGEDQIIGS